MKIIADLHCHTVASTHAYSTIGEYVKEAKRQGLFGFAVTDHASAMGGGAPLSYFMNLVQVPSVIDGVHVLKGAETNIVDHEGNLDTTHELVLSEGDIIIASYHKPVVKPGSVDDHTNCYLKLAEHPYVDILGHSGTEAYSFHYEPVVKAFRDNNKIIEINSNSFEIRAGAKENCKKIALVCKELKAPISVDSDCHSAWHLADVTNAMEMLREIEFPEELIVNADEMRLQNYLKQRKEEKRKARAERLGDRGDLWHTL